MGEDGRELVEPLVLRLEFLVQKPVSFGLEFPADGARLEAPDEDARSGTEGHRPADPGDVLVQVWARVQRHDNEVDSEEHEKAGEHPRADSSVSARGERH